MAAASSTRQRRLVLGAVAVAVVAAAVVALETVRCGYVETGDLPALRGRGRLRILLPGRGEVNLLPRRGHVLDLERTLLAQFSNREKLEPVFVTVDRREDLIPWLLAGRGDVIAGNFTVTAARRKRIAFTSAVNHVREQAVTRVSDHALRSPSDLAGRRVVVRRSSSYWGTALRLEHRHPKLEVVAAPETLDTEEILYRVARHAFDVTVADDNLVEEVRAYLPELRVAFDVTGERTIAWGVRPDAVKLRKALDAFIAKEALGRPREERYRLDLPGLRKRGVLRVLTRNGPSTYFVWRGKLMGFEYELVRRFAKREGLRLEVVIPPTRAALVQWLREGRGDIVAAGLTPTRAREKRGVRFTRPTDFVTEEVVGRAGERPLDGPEDLAGRTLVVRRSSSYWGTLLRLRKRGVSLRMVAAPENLETEEILDRVADGDYDLTVSDSDLLEIERTWRDDLKGLLTLGPRRPHAWAVRAADVHLRAALDTYLRRVYRGTFYNVLHRRYFEDSHGIRGHLAQRAAQGGELSPYDDLVKRVAKRSGFDWRLIVAQMFQESRFDPDARSFSGAVGLLQVQPAAAEAVGVGDPERPDAGVRAGVLYLRRLDDRFEGKVVDRDRIWFALAAYNVGYGHVLDARRLARRLGYDPRRWSHQVERAMPLLAESRYYKSARSGYCRCGAGVRYVREIRMRYRAYVAATERNARKGGAAVLAWAGARDLRTDPPPRTAAASGAR